MQGAQASLLQKIPGSFNLRGVLLYYAILSSNFMPQHLDVHGQSMPFYANFLSWLPSIFLFLQPKILGNSVAHPRRSQFLALSWSQTAQNSLGLPMFTYVYLIFPSAAKILNGVNIPTEILPRYFEKAVCCSMPMTIGKGHWYNTLKFSSTQSTQFASGIQTRQRNIPHFQRISLLKR